MSNSLTAFNQEHWAPTMQATFFKENVAIALANTELRDVLVQGTQVHKPYRSSIIDQAYTKGTDISTFNDLTGTDETLDVDTTRVVPFYVDDLDKLQNKWDVASIYAQDAQRVLNNRIDQDVLSEYSNAYSFVSAGDLGGSGTGSYAVGVGNVANLFTVASRQLDKYNRGQNSRFAVIGPRLRETLKLYVGARETGFGDAVSANGLIGTRFGFDLLFSNNVPFTATLTSSSIPVDGETITIDGVVFTWEANGTVNAAGEVDIKDNEANAYANLVNAINGTGTPGASTYQDVSADDREALRLGRITASYANNVLTITGFGDVVISEATTNLAVTTNVQYPLFGIKGATDLVIQKSPSVEFRMAEKRLGRYVYPWTTFGKKTFTKQKKSLVYAKVDTSGWV